MPEKLIYIITNSDRAGAQQHVRTLIGHFSSIYECELISGTQGYLSDFTVKMGIRTQIFESLSRNISPFDDFRAWLQIRRHLKESQPDIVHLHSAKAGFIGRLATIGLNTKVIYTVHGWAFSEGNSAIKRYASVLLEKAVSKLADRIILVSEYDYRLALKYRISRRDKLTVIHNGISDSLGMDLPERENAVFHAVSLVRFARQKNIPCMIKAISRVDRKLKVSIAGTGKLRSDVENLIHILVLDGVVELVGEISDIELLLSTADVFILSSDWEGLPISIIEACRAGLPIISTDVGGVSEIVDEGENGFLVPPNKPDKFAKAIEVLKDNHQLTKDMGGRSREIFLERFTEEKMLNKTQAIYHSCLST